MVSLDSRMNFKIRILRFILILFLLVLCSHFLLQEATARSEGDEYSYSVASSSSFLQLFEIKLNVHAFESDSASLDLETPVNDFLETNPADFNLSVHHYLNGTAICNVTLDNQLVFKDVEASNSTYSVSNSSFEMNNGAHSWTVLCTIKNDSETTTISKSSNFNVNIPFLIETDKEQYSPEGEVNVTVYAPDGASVHVDIPYTENGFSWVASKDLTGSFPQSFLFTHTSEEGDYNITATLDYLQEELITSKQFVVADPELVVSLSANETEVYVSDSIAFYSSVINSTGMITYLLDFGDNSNVSSSTTSASYSTVHTYSEAGTFTVNLTVQNDGKIKSQTLTVEVETKDSENPTVSLTFPDDGKVFTDSNVFLKYIPYDDKSNLKCGLYLTKYDDSGWGSKKLEDYKTGVTNGTEKTVYLSGLADGKYSWEVNCTDAAGHSGVSSSRSFKIATGEEVLEEVVDNSSSPEKNSTEEIPDVPEVDSVIKEIEETLKRFENLGEDQKRALEDLDLVNKLNKYKTQLKMLARDINNVKYRRDLDETGKKERRDELLKKLFEIQESIPVDLKVLNRKEFIKYNLPENLDDIVLDYIKIKKLDLDDSEKELFIKSVRKAQSQLTVSTEVKQIEISYSVGENEKITLVSKKFELSNSTHSVLLEVIPKDIINSANEIEFLTDVKVIKDDPIIQVDLSKTKKLVYYTKRLLDLGSLEDINSILLTDPSALPKEQNFITGLATFGKDTVKNIGMKGIIMIIALGTLFGVYFFYGPRKTTRKSFNLSFLKDWFSFLNRESSKKLKYLESVIENAYHYLRTNDVDKASKMYEEGILAFNVLEERMQNKVYPKLVNLSYNIDSLFLNNLLTEAMSDTENDRVEEAYKKYKQVQMVYKRLPEDMQMQIYHRCNLLFEKLNKFNNCSQ